MGEASQLLPPRLATLLFLRGILNPVYCCEVLISLDFCNFLFNVLFNALRAREWCRMASLYGS